jgi:hypothetical protein
VSIEWLTFAFYANPTIFIRPARITVLIRLNDELERADDILIRRLLKSLSPGQAIWPRTVTHLHNDELRKIVRLPNPCGSTVAMAQQG